MKRNVSNSYAGKIGINEMTMWDTPGHMVVTIQFKSLPKSLNLNLTTTETTTKMKRRNL